MEDGISSVCVHVCTYAISLRSCVLYVHTGLTISRLLLFGHDANSYIALLLVEFCSDNGRNWADKWRN